MAPSSQATFQGFPSFAESLVAGASHNESQQVIFGGCRETREGLPVLSSSSVWSSTGAWLPLAHGKGFPRLWFCPRPRWHCGHGPGRASTRRSSTRSLALGSPVRVWLRRHSGRRAAATGARLSDLGSHCCHLWSSQGHRDDAADPSRTRDTAATRLEKPSWDRAPSAPRSRPSLRNQPHLRGPAATGCSLAREFSRHNSNPFFPFFFLNNNCSHPSFLVVTHTDTHYMYTIWARGPTAHQGSQHRSGWCTHSAAVKGEVVLLSFKLAMFVFILFFIF